MNTHFSGLLQWMDEKNIFYTQDDIMLLNEHTSVFNADKNSIIMEQNRPVKRFYYINKGIVRLFLKFGDEDITIAFLEAPQFASTINYLFNGLPSPLALETCTEIEALSWSKDDFLLLKQRSGFAEKFESVFTEMLLGWNLDREIDRITLTPEERYYKLIETSKQIVQCVPLKYIASYLGIHQDSISRIRNRMLRRI